MTGPIHLYDRYDEPDQLRDQLRRLLCHRVVIALGIVLGLLGGATLALSRAHTYTSTSDVLERPPPTPRHGRVAGKGQHGHRAADRRQHRGRRPRGTPMGQADGKAAALDALRITNQAKSQVLRFEFTARTPKARGAAPTPSPRPIWPPQGAQPGRRPAGHPRRGAADQDGGGGAERFGGDDATKALRSQLDTLRKRVGDQLPRHRRGRRRPPRRGAHPALGARLADPPALGLASGLALGLLAWLRSALDTRVRRPRGRSGHPGARPVPPGTGEGDDLRRSAARAVTGPRAGAPSPTGCAGPPCPRHRPAAGRPPGAVPPPRRSP
ncbi:hypothetical protein [Streptomyces canarius]